VRRGRLAFIKAFTESFIFHGILRVFLEYFLKIVFRFNNFSEFGKDELILMIDFIHGIDLVE
jgi:hypothetical protein